MVLRKSVPFSGVNGVMEFDVFLSHNSNDKPAVHELAEALRDRDLKIWLDEDELQPGIPWQKLLEEGIRASQSVAVLVGSDGLGPWEDEEMQAALRLAVKDKRPVISVLLPGVSSEPELPLFLTNRPWVDLRDGLTDEGLGKLYWGITGRKPNQKSEIGSQESPIAISPTRLRHGTEELFGREGELKRLDVAWEDPKTKVITIVAWGGVGKTSLVMAWMARMAAEEWRGAARVFDWSFYSQGTRETGSASSETFLAEALRFFGDPDLAESNASGWDKGRRLAELVARKRSLLILDGLEPLQYPPGPLAGQIKDPALEALLKGVAQHNPGLCVVTTRESVADLGPWHSTTAPEWRLERLDRESGARLLHSLGVRRAGAAEIGPDDAELKTACDDVDGHALTLRLLGNYLSKAHGGDVRKRSLARLDQADPLFKTGRMDAGTPYGHAFKVMGVYANWLAESGAEGQRQLALMRLMGFFDRPADPACIAALCEAPAIPDLAEPLIGLGAADWSVLAADLEEAGLVRPSPWEPKKVSGYSEEKARESMEQQRRGYSFGLGEPEDFASAPLTTHHSPLASALESHPLVREYFAARLRSEHPDAWQEGHRRLCEHLRGSVPYWPEGFEGLQPLYQAVSHGCQAGLHEEACDGVYRDRIQRGTGSGGFYSTKKLGAVGADLGAVACFFEEPWRRLSPNLSEVDQAWLLNQAAVRLSALGRLTEAVEPMRMGIAARVKLEQFGQAAVSASNLSALELTLGEVDAAVADGEQSVTFADRSEDEFLREVTRTVNADALHQAGRREEAGALFREAEAMQAKRQPSYPRLYSLRGFRYCDLLLSEAEREAWRKVVAALRDAASPGESPEKSRRGASGPLAPGESPEESRPNVVAALRDASSPGGSPEESRRGASGPLSTCREVEERATQTLEWGQKGGLGLLDIALDHLTLARAALYSALLADSEIKNQKSKIENHIAAAVDGLRQASTTHHMPCGLLTLALLRQLEGDPGGARQVLDQAWEIAERGPMRLHMADIQLTRARLLIAEVSGQKSEGRDHEDVLRRAREYLAQARKITEDCGYWRRKEELEDAEEAARQWETTLK